MTGLRRSCSPVTLNERVVLTVSGRFRRAAARLRARSSIDDKALREPTAREDVARDAVEDSHRSRQSVLVSPGTVGCLRRIRVANLFSAQFAKARGR